MVVAASKKFIWVEINRDHTPEIPKRFNMSAYPSLIVLGKKEENIHRWEAYLKPKEFIAHLDEGLRRYALYKKGEEWSTPDPRPASICDEAKVSTFAAPSDFVPAGMVFYKGDLWIGQTGSRDGKYTGQLSRLDKKTGKVKQTFALPTVVMDLATDGRYFYAVESGWTSGGSILVLDPETLKTVRKMANDPPVEKGSGANGIAYADGKLFVFAGMRGVLYAVDPQSGKVLKTIKTPLTWMTGLSFDGKYLVAGGRTDLALLDPVTGAVVRKVPVNYRLRSVGYNDGEYYLMEQPIWGFDKYNKRVQVWPKPEETKVYVLNLNAPQRAAIGQ